MGNCGSLPKTKGSIDVSVPAPKPTTTKDLVETKEEEEVKVQQEEKKIDGNVGEQNAGSGKSGNENEVLAVGSLLNEVPFLFVMIIDQVHSFLFIFQLITLAD